jgi:chaperonin cofactor prefoldin
MGRKSEKRKKSGSSPNVVSEVQPDKRLAMANSSSGFQQNGSYLQQLSNCTPQSGTGPLYSIQGMGIINTMSNMNNMSSNVTPNMNTYMPACSPTPIYQTIGSPVSVPPPPSYHQMVLDKLESMDKRLNKLDYIEQQVNKINERVSSLDTRISHMESKLHDQGRKLIDIEASRNFDAQLCDEIQKKQSELDRTLRQERSQQESMKRDYETLKSENSRLSSELVDLQARSMRDNLLFFGFEEESTAEARKAENCREQVLNLCEINLEIPNANQLIKLPRVHRIGKYISGKTRPIVANFLYTPDKYTVKQAAFEKLKDTDYRVSDQYPRAIQEKRRQLIPDLEKARKDGYEAYISYDKLVIRGRRNRVSPVARTPTEATAMESETASV